MVSDSEEQELLRDLEGREAAMLERLQRLVDLDSYTDDIDGVAAVASVCGEWLSDAGFRVEFIERPHVGPHLVARSSAESESERGGVLLLGHTDTVYPQDHAVGRFRPDAERSGIWRGPGVTDMKGGVVVMIEAASALRQRGLLENLCLDLFLCADEETGAPTGAEWVRKEAQGRDLVLVYETGSVTGENPPGSSYVLERKGCARFTLEIRGVEAHSGARKEEGLSALLSAARIVIALESWNDPARGLTLNVGVLEAGTAANVVPGEARLEIDARFVEAEDGEALQARIDDLARAESLEDPSRGTTTSHRLVRRSFAPPLRATETSRRAAQTMEEAARDLGETLTPEFRGGASDGNHAAGVGAAVLDGLGTIGGKIHSADEWVVGDSLLRRAKLTATFLKRWRPS